MTEAKPRVYVVQRAAFRRGGEWVDRYDMTPAREYGALVYLLPPGNVASDLTETVARLDHRLMDYRSGMDHLLAAGDPVAIAAAVVRCAKWSAGPVSLLKWDGRLGQYFPYEIPIE